VHRVLDDVKAAEVPRVLVLNKADRLDADERARLGARHADTFVVSARDGTGVEALLDEVGRRLGLDTRVFSVELDPAVPADRDRLASLYRSARVLRHDEVEGRVRLDVELPRRLAERLVPGAVGS
jgi:GTP-binding protein HflX